MVRSQFEEKTYECAYNVELATGAGGNPRMFSPGQVLEGLVGFDSAADPDPNHLIWQLLKVPRPPGLSLLPTHWGATKRGTVNAEQLPRIPLSLMLQFKRPEYLTTANASQWKLWSNPYYRFVRDAEQHRVLRRLDRSLAGDVTVRYAAPAFHLLSDLEAAQLAGEVIARSGHVSPEELGSHKVWTYQVSGTTGQGNPDGAELPFLTLQQLFVRQPAVAGTVGEVSVYEGLERHLDTVAVVCRERTPALRAVIDRWQQSLARSNLGLDRRAALINYATIQTFCSWQRISWWLLDGLQVRPAG